MLSAWQLDAFKGRLLAWNPPMRLYHVTHEGRLSRIATEGLLPGQRRALGGRSYDAHVAGGVFLTGPSGLPFWYHVAEQWAHHEADDLLAEGWIPVVLRVVAHRCKDDSIGTRDARHPAFKCREEIPPERIELWNGSEWLPIADYERLDPTLAVDDEGYVLPSSQNALLPDLGPASNPATIKLAYKSGRYEVPAIIVAKNWAIHRTPLPFEKKPTRFSKTWIVTHIPTGRAAWTDIKHQAVAEHAALLAARLAPDTRGLAATAEALRDGHFRSIIWYTSSGSKGRSAKAIIAFIDELEKEFNQPKKTAKKKRGKLAVTKKAKRQKPAPKRRAIDLIALARKARRERERNPRGRPLSLFEANPSYLVKKGQFPKLVVGQVGRESLYRYGDWEIVVRQVTPHYWSVTTVPDRDFQARGEHYSTTYDGAVCVGKIEIDYQEALYALDDPETGYLAQMWMEIYRLAKSELSMARRLRTRPPDRQSVARGLEVLRRSAMLGDLGYTREGAYKWWQSLSLDARLGLIEERLQLLYCAHGTDPRLWP